MTAPCRLGAAAQPSAIAIVEPIVEVECDAGCPAVAGAAPADPVAAVAPAAVASERRTVASPLRAPSPSPRRPRSTRRSPLPRSLRSTRPPSRPRSDRPSRTPSRPPPRGPEPASPRSAPRSLRAPGPGPPQLGPEPELGPEQLGPAAGPCPPPPGPPPFCASWTLGVDACWACSGVRISMVPTMGQNAQEHRRRLRVELTRSQRIDGRG
jgi:hypothetical protein